DHDIKFMFFTYNSMATPRDLAARLGSQGLDIPSDKIWTSALATAKFLSQKSTDRTGYVISRSGLTTALHDARWIFTGGSRARVVLSETRTYSCEAITTAINLIRRGARFIATNPDVTGPAPQGILPASGSVAALITAATNREPYYVGKPNPV